MRSNIIKSKIQYTLSSLIFNSLLKILTNVQWKWKDKRNIHSSHYLIDIIILWLSVWCHFSNVQLFAILWIVAHQASLSMGFSRILEWVAMPSPGASSQPRDWTVSLMSFASARQFLYHYAIWGACKIKNLK